MNIQNIRMKLLFIRNTKVRKYLMPYFILLLVLFPFPIHAQKTLMLEKIGTTRKFYYHVGDYMKLRVSDQDTLLKGKLWDIGDTVISVSELRPFDVKLRDIGSIYKRYYFPRKLSAYLAAFGVGIFAVMVTNHLINNEQVFTPDMLIISGSFLGASLISFSLSQKRYKIGYRWKVKVLNINLY